MKIIVAYFIFVSFGFGQPEKEQVIFTKFHDKIINLKQNEASEVLIKNAKQTPSITADLLVIYIYSHITIKIRENLLRSSWLDLYVKRL
ncbi:hypothetical protein PQO03_01410 [Lentisphaera profundi]|uniref:Uncharacterized protein n=1 Tax=Lentisphaera profundi TaxID=1658616 RepID=A0ABY7VV56_9BACT|nr:hypothetical protein [Lentisphaera profundi]WDE96624.1 hypothetical protein PQO03_01410 [Lentisphaera profundi]